jgi:D-alanine-D-alanine ligase
MRRKLRTAVLSGGPGSEREVSINSGKNIVAALRAPENAARYEVILIDVRDPSKVPSQLAKVKPDVIFPIVHGTFGEDGTLQALLEVFGKPYVGSGLLASAICMDKLLSTKLVALAGLAVPKHLDVRRSSYPCVVKPRASGSSVGVSIVRNKRDLTKALRTAAKEGEPIIQEYIRGTEVSCGVLDFGEGSFALPVTEMVLTREFHDYKSKYIKGACQEITPARISAALTRQVQAATLLAHKTLGCRHISRSDFILRGKTIYYLETNTSPGMTDTSLIPQAAAVAGWPMPLLADRLVRAALLQ